MVHLHDLWTTKQLPFASKLTNTLDHYLHDHTFFEVFYVLDGSIQHTINGVTETLFPGDMYFIKPEDKHCFLREPNNTSKHRDIIFRKAFFEDICRFLSPELYEDFLHDRYKKKISISIQEMSALENALNALSALPRSRTGLILSSSRAIAAELLNKLLLGQDSNTLTYPSWFQELLLRLNDSALIKAGLNEILSPFYYSREYVCRSFKKYMGMTLTDYLNDQRLTLAAHALTYTNNSILTICTDIGFSSVSYFNKIFKQKFSCTPLAFRKKAM